ncbi:MAG: outer membrane protein assembly factor BamE [Deltaproteobacteria bacterium]|nr:outer membrane protein assembly factor BamE [Deltaproteobacteria bacterium]
MSSRKSFSRRFVLWSLAVSLIVVAWAGSGCSLDDPMIVTGREFPFERVVALQKGKSTRKDVEDLLGPPFKRDKISESKERWRYFMRKETVNRVFLIPYRTDVTQKELLITFHGNFMELMEKNHDFYTSS